MRPFSGRLLHKVQFLKRRPCTHPCPLCSLLLVPAGLGPSVRKVVCSSSISRGALTGDNLGGSFRSRATLLTAPSSGTLPVRLAPAAPNSDVMTAMPATEPRAAAPALPMIVAAPAAIRGAARPPVTPTKKAESRVKVGVRMWPAGLFSPPLPTAFHRGTRMNEHTADGAPTTCPGTPASPSRPSPLPA